MVPRPVLPETMRQFENALTRRIGYLLITGRLSERSRDEMKVLSSELNEIAKALPQTTAGVALRSHLLTAYTREVRRAGSVIVADGREQREASERLRLRAKAVRDASARAAARSRLRVLPDTPIANLASLQRALESGGGGFRRSARSLAAPLSGLLA